MGWRCHRARLRQSHSKGPRLTPVKRMLARIEAIRWLVSAMPMRIGPKVLLKRTKGIRNKRVQIFALARMDRISARVPRVRAISRARSSGWVQRGSAGAA